MPVTDAFIVVTLKGLDSQSDWAFITGLLLVSCLSGKHFTQVKHFVMPYTGAFLCLVHLKVKFMLYLVLFHCSFTAEEVPVEYVMITETDFRYRHQRHKTGISNPRSM